MLVLTAKYDTVIHLFTDAGERISITAIKKNGSTEVRMGFDVPESVLVLRDVYYQKLAEQGLDLTSVAAIRAGAQALHAAKKRDA